MMNGTVPNSVAGLSNLQMRALNDSMCNMLNAGLDQIHQRLDEIQASQAPSIAGARRDRPRRNTGSDDEIQEEDDQEDEARSAYRPRRGPRTRDPGDVNPFARNERTNDRLSGLKLKIPSFEGKNDPNVFLEWERKIEHVFNCQNFSELKKVRLAVTEFSGYAINWYDQVVTHRRRTGERPIETWDEFSMLMRRRFVPAHYHRDLHQKLRRLLQGTKSMEDYHQEMETLMIKADVDEPMDATMARFLSGLNRDIQDRMELQEYDSVEQMLHKAILIEQQVKRKSFSKPAITSKPAYSSKPAFSPKPSYQDKVESEDEQEDKEDLGPIFDDEDESFGYPHQGPLLVARKGMIESIFDETDGRLVDGSDPAFDDESDPIYDEEAYFDYPAHGPLLVTRRSLSVQPKTNEKEKRENLFHSRSLVSEKVCSLIIDGGSCTNVASDTLIRKLGLATRPLSHPFRLEWLNEAGEQYVKEQVTVHITIGRYEDEVVCNVLPMDACHILLGRPWQFDKRAVHDGCLNRYCR
ncbi:PREDICTED: uncharacterized protein LOC106338309 [Brassica oleracea var. oleracea]|uniref:uncharacterized protein LOC106338309 n=1 Tax=Brassica oleracea var. oleracea TaxID=109376 RepID=UPI0006A6E7AD|nr:PREDICTED: uncharacterized protein LOC106338309 [Brassica oleracea var. oleracea]